MNILRGFVDWLFALLLLAGITAATGLGAAAISPQTGLIAAIATFFVANLLLTKWLRDRKIERETVRRFGHQATPIQRDAVTRQVRVDEARNQELAAHLANQQRLRNQQQQQQLQQQRNRANQIHQVRQRASVLRPPNRGR
ncbi:MAG: hypothetical protein KDA96_07595 [Planctomycetaceae bacterium]|nr:hypothetical protein [Planctomycetaceae bacterium]